MRLALGLVLVAACGDSGPTDRAADSGMDVTVDAAVGAADAGVDGAPPDAALPDAALPDGALPDAALPDAPADTGVDAASEDAGEDAAPEDAGPLTASRCISDMFVTPSDFGPDYDAFSPTIGSHCNGTNHQDIRDVERVVFLGDSVTVGTPPTPTERYYRVQLAERLADRFRLERNEGLLHGFEWERWTNVDLFEGVSTLRTAGDFSSCAKWGARVDDLIRDNTQIEDCFPMSERGQRTLVVMTVGGNDIANLTEGMLEGETVDALWEQAREIVSLLEGAVDWIVEPGRFPGGVDVVFANIYEFTDGTGDVSSCEGAALAGFDGELSDPDALAEIVVWINEQYMRVAVETGTDLVFLLESFCGHGFNADDPTTPCYRGPGAETWFDVSCTHPNPTGHDEIADLFMSIVNE
ncbi:MAG: SGNH/GDSL hydrolase family protein [Myxococcota bacterium]